MENCQEFVSLLLKTNPKELIDRLSEGMTGTTPILLYLSQRREKEVLAGELADYLSVSTARIAVILERMQKKGLLEKYKPIRDKRMTVVHITEKGLAVLNDAINNLRSFIEEKLSVLEEDERKTLIALLEKLVKANAIRKQVEDNANAQA